MVWDLVEEFDDPCIVSTSGSVEVACDMTGTPELDDDDGGTAPPG